MSDLVINPTGLPSTERRAVVPTGHGSIAPRPLDAERLIERWRTATA
jgi:hypothetical protein